MTPQAAESLLVEIRGELGVSQTPHLAHGSADWALAIADAANAVTKRNRQDLYAVKADAINAAIALGCDRGWKRRARECEFVLSTPNAGVAWFHLTDDDAKQISQTHADWKPAWSGVKRHPFAVAALTDSALFQLLANHTQPGRRVDTTFWTAIRGNPDWSLLWDINNKV